MDGRLKHPRLDVDDDDGVSWSTSSQISCCLRVGGIVRTQVKQWREDEGRSSRVNNFWQVNTRDRHFLMFRFQYKFYVFAKHAHSQS
jgi:hypothetical protein